VPEVNPHKHDFIEVYAFVCMFGIYEDRIQWCSKCGSVNIEYVCYEDETRNNTKTFEVGRRTSITEERNNEQ